MSVTVADVLEVFLGATLVTCGACHGTRWRQVGDGLACVTCHPAPAASQLRAVPPMPVPQGWRAPHTTTTRQWREIVWATPRRSLATGPEVFEAGPAQRCIRCGGRYFVRLDVAGDECAVCLLVSVWQLVGGQP